jgi:hypothetical protein
VGGNVEISRQKTTYIAHTRAKVDAHSSIADPLPDSMDEHTDPSMDKDGWHGGKPYGCLLNRKTHWIYQYYTPDEYPKKLVSIPFHIQDHVTMEKAKQMAVLEQWKTSLKYGLVKNQWKLAPHPRPHKFPGDCLHVRMAGGHVFYTDEKNVPLIQSYTWVAAHPERNGRIYVATNNWNGISQNREYLHRILTGCQPGEVNHYDGDTLNNIVHVSSLFIRLIYIFQLTS